QRRILIADVAIQLRALRNLLGYVEIAARIDDGIQPARVGLDERDCSDGDNDGNEDGYGVSGVGCRRFISHPRLPTPNSPESHSFIVSGSTPRLLQKSMYANGEISDGLISLRPPQKTFVYDTGIPIDSRCASMAALCASTASFSVPCATAMMFTLRNSGPPSRQ